MHATHAMSIFVRAVQVNSFAGAARSLLIDRSAVSRAIKALEAELGILLFARSTRALTLTQEGERFYRDCVEILTKLEQATRRFHARLGSMRGQLKVGIAPAFGRRILLRAIPTFQRQYPELEIIVLGVDGVPEIGEKGIDVLIRSRGLRKHGGLHPEPQGLVMRKLAQSRFVVCASPEYLEKSGRPRKPDDLLRHACVVNISMERDVHDQWRFTRSHLRHDVRTVPKLLVQGNEALREAALAGCGIIRVSACYVEDELRSRKLIPLIEDWECTGSPAIVAVYRRTRPALQQVSAFVRHLVEEFRPYDIH
jgi:LysR family transcriptional regulator, regulator for bpeEF and oprC